MDTKVTTQVIIYDGPTHGSYSLTLPHQAEAMIVSGSSGTAVAKQLATLWPEFSFVYDRDPSLVWDTKLDRFVRDRDASVPALFDAGTTFLERTLYSARKEINKALDEGREPDYATHISEIVRAFAYADRYFWIAETRAKAESVKKPASKLNVRPPNFNKTSADTDGDYPGQDKTPRDAYHKDIWGNKDIWTKMFTEGQLPFGVGYGYITDEKDIDKLLKQIEGILGKKAR